MKTLYDAADAAGRKAADECVPEPMMLRDTLDASKPIYYVPQGVCGFAWINVKPGNSKFANWLKKEKIGRPDSYYGGVSVWVGAYNQSMEKKQAYG
jgi:hypothetical protein